jgi:hypothetical protein
VAAGIGTMHSTLRIATYVHDDYTIYNMHVLLGLPQVKTKNNKNTDAEIKQTK